MGFDERVRAWVAAAAGPGVRVVGAVRLGAAEGSPLGVDLAGPGAPARVVLRLGDPSDDASLRKLRTESAALEAAERHGVPAARPLAADLDGSACGRLALLATLVPGSSAIPADPPLPRLRALGAAAARLHAVRLEPTPALPSRDHPVGDTDFAATRRAEGSTALIDLAQGYLDVTPAPAEPAGLCHGDLWQGNALFTGSRLEGLIDWDAAGVGAAGVDLGCLRCDAHVSFGEAGADAVAEGWAAEASEAYAHLDHWDVVAALSTPVDWVEWAPLYAAQGRPDITPASATAGRDEFLAVALRRLGVG